MAWYIDGALRTPDFDLAADLQAAAMAKPRRGSYERMTFQAGRLLIEFFDGLIADDKDLFFEEEACGVEWTAEDGVRRQVRWDVVPLAALPVVAHNLTAEHS